MSRDRFDDILMQKLSHESMKPPHSVWSKLEKKLAELDATAIESSAQEGAKQVRLNSKRAKLWWYAAAASLLLTAGIIGLQYSLLQSVVDQEAGPMAISTTTEQVNPAQSTVEAEIAGAAQSDGLPTATEKVKIMASIVQQASDATAHPTKSVRTTVLSTSPTATSQIGTSPADTQQLPTATSQLPADTQPVTTSKGAISQAQPQQVAAQTKSYSADTPSTALRSAATAVQGQSTDNKIVAEHKQKVDWNKLLTEQTKKERKLLSTSLFASNFGGGANSENIKAVNRLTYSNLIINEDVQDLGNKDNGLSTHSTPNQITDQKLIHKIPFSFGLSLGIGLTDLLSLETGVTYTKLNSQSESKGISKYKLDQNLHYIGIPVSLICNIIDGGHARLYARGGATIEKCVSATRKIETTGENNIVSSQSNKMNVSGIQASVGAAIGGEWKINKLLGLYLEPGVGYFFENKSQPESYRSENPLNFTIKAGLRININ